MATAASLPEKLRDVKRYFEILRVLIKHGFKDIVDELNLDEVLEKGMSLILSREPAPIIEHLSRPVRVRRVFEELGTTFIKLGQVLSTRPDLVPAAWADEFRLLQNSCPQIPFAEVQQRLKSEFPGSLRKTFRSVDRVPLAAASIAQVHRAVLKDGSKVLIKVMRPGIEERIEADIAILGSLADLTEQYFSNLGYSPTALVDEFRREIHRELDFSLEAAAIERFRGIFADDPSVHFPKVYWQGTTTRVLAEEEIKGVLLSDPAALKLPPSVRRTFVENATRAVLCQCLEAGYFHADPHPGNLFVLDEGRIGFIDCGMVGQLDTVTMNQLAELVSGVASADAEKVARVIAMLTDSELELLDQRAFHAGIRDLIAPFQHSTLGRLSIGDLLQQFFTLLRSHRLRCPAELVLLIKSLTTIQSVARDFDPEFDFVSYSQPFVERLVARQHSFSEIRKRIEKSMVGYAELLETFPDDVRQIIRHVRGNKFTVNVEHRGLSKLTSVIEHASRNISFAMIVAAMLIGSSILVLSDRSGGREGVFSLGLIGFGAACVLLGIRLITNWRYRD